MTKKRMLVRHAQSVANQGGATRGDVTQIPLSAEGERDAAGFDGSLLNGSPELMVCSQNLRSQQTCRIIQQTYYHESPIEVWDDIQEFHFLDFGERLTTPTQRRPHVDRYFAECDPYRRDPGAESWADLYNRCVALDQKLAGHAAKTLLLVGHGYFLITLLTLRSMDFPPISNSLMNLVHTNQLTRPIRNLQAFMLEYPMKGAVQ